MSHFVECQTEFKDPEALVSALIECGFTEDQVEIHAEPTQLFGYQGDVRPQQAHIVIRRQHIATGANDVGWERQDDGSYKAWISEYDSGVGQYKSRAASARFNQQMQDQIKQEYAYQVISRQQRTLGRTVERQRLSNGELELTISGYR